MFVLAHMIIPRKTPLADWLSHALLAIMLALCLRFGFAQQVWIDESTQLSGISVAPFETIRWLAGENQSRFGVPGDRMPPLSYLLDWAWSRIFGDAPLGLRIFHMLVVLVATAALAMALRKRLGPLPTLAFVLLTALSPTLIVNAVEIRAYPFLYAFTAFSLVWFLQMASPDWQGERRPLIWFVGFSLASAYSHFFGLVASCSLLAGLAIINMNNFVRLRSIVAAGIVYLVLCAGLVPFIMSASGLTGAAPMAVPPQAFVQYLVKLFVTPHHLIFPLFGVIYALGLMTLLIGGAYASFQTFKSANNSQQATTRISLSLIVVLGIGVGVTILTNILQTSFFAIKDVYSLWTAPVIFTLAAAGVAQLQASHRNLRLLGVGAIGFAALGGACAALALTLTPSYSIHGPSGYLSNLIGDELDETAVIYTQGATAGYGAFPLNWRYGGRATQVYFDDKSQALTFFSHPADVPPRVASLSDFNAFKTLLVVDITTRSFDEVGKMMKGASLAPQSRQAIQFIAAESEWTVEKCLSFPGFYSTYIWRFVRQGTEEKRAPDEDSGTAAFSCDEIYD